MSAAMAGSESKITLHFYDSNDKKLNISSNFNVSSNLNSLFHHIATFPFIFNKDSIDYSEITIKPRICQNHSGWHCDTSLTILDALKALNMNENAINYILANSFDCIVSFTSTSSPPSSIHIENTMECMLSSDDNQSVYTVNTAMPEMINHHQTHSTETCSEILQLPNTNFLNLPSLNTSFDDMNNTKIQNPNANIIDIEVSDTHNDLPPDLAQNDRSNNEQLLSNQYIRTQHQLMGKDVVIPCPAIPHSFDLMTKLPNFPNLSKYATSNHINFGTQNDDELNGNNQINKASYYHKIQQINEDKNGQNYDFLNIFPKRIIPQNAEKCTIWTNDFVPSLSSFLLKKKEQRRQETDNNLQRIRIGTHKSSHSQPQCLQNNDDRNDNQNDDENEQPILNLVQAQNNVYGSSMSYYDELMNASNTNQNPLQFLTCSVDERILLEPIQTKCIELKDANGRLLRLTQELEAINLVQPWAHCLVHKLCKIFCFKSEFESKKYPNGCWYPIRVHATKSNSKQIVEDCEMLSNVIDGVPVFKDCIHTAQHVIGFVHVHKSSVFIEDVAEIHPNLTDVYKHCHGGLPSKLCPNDDDNDNDNEVVTKEEENESIEYAEDKYDDSGYWLEEKYGSLSPTKDKKIKKNQRHYWFVDKVFRIEPYEVCGTLGGVSKFYNLTKRNYKDSLVLGEKLANYLMMQQMSMTEQEITQRYEYDDGTGEEKEEEEAKESDDNDNGLDAEGDIIYLDRTLAKHVGIKSKKKQKKLNADKAIIGWKNVLNDMSVVEVEQIVTMNEEIKECEEEWIKKEKEEKQNEEEPAVRCLEMYEAVGMDMNMMDNDDENGLFEQSVAPHIDDSTDSDYLGDEEEQIQNEQQCKSPSIMSNSLTISMEPLTVSVEANHENIKKDLSEQCNDEEVEEDDDDDIDLEDIEMELLDLNTVTFVTKGGPNEQIKQEMNDAIERELEDIVHDEDVNEDIDINQENESEQSGSHNLSNSDKENAQIQLMQMNEEEKSEENAQCDDDSEKLECGECVIQIKEEMNEDVDLRMNVMKTEAINVNEYEMFIEENQFEIEDEMMSFIEESQTLLKKENKSENVLGEILVINEKNMTKNVFENEQIAFDKINESVINILTNIDDEQKKLLSKKKLRKMVAKKLNISKTRYKHLIDQCGKLFVESQRY